MMMKKRITYARKISRFLLNYHFRGSDILRRKICKFLMPANEGPVICSTLYDVDMLVDPKPQNIVEHSIYNLGAFEAGTLTVLKNKLSKGAVFLDVGANIGFISCVIARFLGENGFIYSIEPHPDTFKILKQNITINNIENIYAFQIALGERISEMDLYDDPRGDRGSASLIPPYGRSEIHGVKVKITTIDRLIEHKTIKSPTMIKIDVEGFELQVLRGAKNLLNSSKAPTLCVEYSLNNPQFGGNTFDIYKFIKFVNDYRIFKLEYGRDIPSKLIEIKDKDDLPKADNIFCFLNKSHLI